MQEIVRGTHMENLNTCFRLKSVVISSYLPREYHQI